MPASLQGAPQGREGRPNYNIQSLQSLHWVHPITRLESLLRDSFSFAASKFPSKMHATTRRGLRNGFRVEVLLLCPLHAAELVDRQYLSVESVGADSPLLRAVR